MPLPTMKPEVLRTYPGTNQPALAVQQLEDNRGPLQAWAITTQPPRDFTDWQPNEDENTYPLRREDLDAIALWWLKQNPGLLSGYRIIPEETAQRAAGYARMKGANFYDVPSVRDQAYQDAETLWPSAATHQAPIQDQVPALQAEGRPVSFPDAPLPQPRPLEDGGPSPSPLAMVDNDTDLLSRLKTVKTMPELDAMRMEVVQAIHAGGTEETFNQLQGAFIKAKNRLQRTPLSDRTW